MVFSGSDRLYPGISAPCSSISHWSYQHIIYRAQQACRCYCTLTFCQSLMVFSRSVYSPKYFCFGSWILYQFTGHNQHGIFRKCIHTQVFLHLCYQGAKVFLLLLLDLVSVHWSQPACDFQRTHRHPGVSAPALPGYRLCTDGVSQRLPCHTHLQSPW